MKKQIFWTDANSSYGHPMSQPMPYDEIKFDRTFEIEGISNTPDVSDIRFL